MAGRNVATKKAETSETAVAGVKSGAALLSKTLYRLQRLSRRLWVRAAGIAALGIVAALASRFLGFLVPDVVVENLDASSVVKILDILASSMLAVTIFSLSVMVSARQAASSQVTPRTHEILLEDTTTQGVLATFLGAFVFALVGLIVLGTGLYSTRTAAVILAFTLVVIALVVIAILRWIDHLTELGSMIETTRKVEEAARAALEKRRAWPCLGAHPLTEGQLEIPAEAAQMRAWGTGYVQHIDLAALSRAAEKADGRIWLVVAPGKLMSAGDLMLYHTGDLTEDAVKRAFTTADTRTFEQDPRFGIIVLTEIAQRALSPGINDPGTAIDVLSRHLRLMQTYREETVPDGPPHFPRIWMPPITADDLMRDGFDPIARDAGGSFGVQLRLQKALRDLARLPEPALAAAARTASARALQLALPELRLDEQKEALKKVAESV
jgi:uncharacterized membrane protein